MLTQVLNPESIKAKIADLTAQNQGLIRDRIENEIVPSLVTALEQRKLSVRFAIKNDPTLWALLEEGLEPFGIAIDIEAVEYDSGITRYFAECYSITLKAKESE